jgi:hypothetical protein
MEEGEKCYSFVLFWMPHEIMYCALEELDSPAVSALRCAIAEAKLNWSVIGWVTKNLLSRAPPCVERHVKPLVLAVFVVVISALGPRGGIWPVLLMDVNFWYSTSK